ncbi:MAG: serine/threonine-protein phosphatase, partial [Bdellovibrionales bacterium]|nr:serine/threonine-protein phosphatase [Bdellovibrionales bacterium]
PPGRFVTAAVAIYEPMGGRLRVARAGHPPPYLWRAATGVVEKIEPKGLPLGVTSGMPYGCFETTLQPGDKLLMITDGLTEAANMDGQML